MNQIRKFSTCQFGNLAKRVHWTDIASKTTNVDRALEHFDDFYGSVYTRNWPSLRLGLRTTQKYMAIPNNFSDPDSVCRKLEELGAYDVHSLWNRGNHKIQEDLNQQEVATKEKERLLELDKTLTTIASTKVAEEMETLYANALPDAKIPYVKRDNVENKRTITSVQEASTEFIPPSKLKGIEDFEFDSEYYSLYQDDQSETAQNVEFTNCSNAPNLKLPSIRPYSFLPGSSDTFPPAIINKSSGLREWICVNGSSIIPIIALDLTPTSNLLDLCAGPGTKTLLSLMTFCPVSVTANDYERCRLDRIKKLLNEFLGTRTPLNVNFTRYNATKYPSTSVYDRVLVDVPCSSDRVSVTVPENSLFNPKRMRERLNIVKTQKSILLSGLSCLSKECESTLVYSTCTLSPIENDGTIGAALKETQIGNLIVDIEGLWKVVKPFQEMGLMKISRTKFGILIEPSCFSNFGPMFVSRILLR